MAGIDRREHMKISFLQGVTMAHPEDSILLISHFDSDGAMLLHQTIECLFVEREIVVTGKILVENGDGLILTFALSDLDQGCIKKDNHLLCSLRAESWKKAQEGIRALVSRSRGFQYLYDVNCPIDIVISPSGAF